MKTPTNNTFTDLLFLCDFNDKNDPCHLKKNRTQAIGKEQSRMQDFNLI